MSEKIIQELSLQVDKSIQDAKAVADNVERIGTEADKAGIAGKKMGSDVASGLKQAQAASQQLEKTIREQERLTNKWRQELIQVERRQKNVGKGTAEYFRLQKAQKDLNAAIKENVQDIKGLKLQKKDVDANVRNLKRQQ